MKPCDICGKDDFKIGFDKARHMKLEHPKPKVEVEVPRETTSAYPGLDMPLPAPPQVPGGPAILADWRQLPNADSGYGQRSVKMLRPICVTCQSSENVQRGWWFDCTHDPYVTLRKTEEQVPVYETQPDGSLLVRTVNTVVRYVPTPNRVDVALTPKINGGKGVAMARGKGFIMPSELRSPHYPNGIADACQYWQCWKQTGLSQHVTEEEEGPHDWGTFCRRTEYMLVWKVENPDTGALEIGWDIPSRRRRRTQLAGAPA